MRHIRHILTRAVAFAVLWTGVALATACKSETARAKADSGRRDTTRPDTTRADTTRPDSARAKAATDSTPATPAEPSVIQSDDNAFALLDTLYASLQEGDRLGQQKATNPLVRTLAQRMVTRDGSSRETARNIAGQLHVKGALPAGGTALVEKNLDALRGLRAMSAAAFDSAYLDRVVATRSDAIEELVRAIKVPRLSAEARQLLDALAKSLDEDRKDVSFLRLKMQLQEQQREKAKGTREKSS